MPDINDIINSEPEFLESGERAVYTLSKEEAQEMRNLGVSVESDEESEIRFRAKAEALEQNGYYDE